MKGFFTTRACIQAFCLLISVHTGSLFSMLTSERWYTLKAGDAVVLACEFSVERFDLFESPVLWRKTQAAESSIVNLLGDINQPFSLTRRFEVSFTRTAPTYLLELSIRDVAIEDSANYTCEVRQQSRVIGSVTHHVAVRNAVKRLFITTLRNTSSAHLEQRTAPLTFVQGQARRVGCVARGGYPLPDMLVYIGSEDVTANFTLRTSRQRGGVRGLRVMTYTVERWTRRLDVTARHDGRRLQCVVTVPGMSGNVTTRVMKVKYRPVVRCRSTKTHIGEENVSLRCNVTAKPSVTSLYWTIDVNGTRLSEGDGVVDGYWTITRDAGNSVWESLLFMQRSELGRYRTYTITAKNAVGVTSNDVDLIRGYSDYELRRLGHNRARTARTRERADDGYTYLGIGSRAASATHPLHALVVMTTAYLASIA